MKLIKSKVEILTSINGDEIIKTIASVARTCYKSEVNSTKEKDEALVKRLIESKHEAMIEFADITVKFICNRGVSHELVRHRLSSFAQESTRYCNYSKDKFGNELTFIIPSWITDIPNNSQFKDKGDVNKFVWGNIDERIEKDGFATIKVSDFTRTFLYNCVNSELNYIHLINKGYKPQEARAILPTCIKTEINMKANLREWRHFFRLRCDSAAHPDIRILALDLLKQLHEQIPIIFDDLYEEYVK